MPDGPIALQMYSVSQLTERDMIGTLERIAEIGYSAVELAGYGNSTAPQIRATLDRLHMRALASHLELPDVEARPSETVNDLSELGCEYGVIAWLDPSLYPTEAVARNTVDRLKRAADLLGDAGLKFAYHNHDFEFSPLGVTTLWDILLASTDPGMMKLEVDVHWVRHSGRIPAELISELGSRVALIHAKDTWPSGSGRDGPIGEGIEDWPAVIAAARSAGVNGYIVEQEHPSDTLPDLAHSLNSLRRLLAAA